MSKSEPEIDLDSMNSAQNEDQEVNQEQSASNPLGLPKEIIYPPKQDFSEILDEDQNKKEESPIQDEESPFEKFSGPLEKPKTANKAFGSISDFLLFFENRNPEIKNFAKKFQEMEDMLNKDLSLSLKILNENVVPALYESLQNIPVEFENYESSKPISQEDELMLNLIKTMKKFWVKKKSSQEEQKVGNEYSKLFNGFFKSLEEFYKQILHAYTVPGFLYLQMNKHLRTENWIKLDDLLIYTYCLFKAYLWGPTGLTDADSFEFLKSQSVDNKLTLYRRADFDQKSIEFYHPGQTKEFAWSAVTSTSLDEKATRPFAGKKPDKKPVLIVIEVDFTDLKPENFNALYLAKLSKCPFEKEVALAPGSIFQLLDVKTIKEEVEIRLRLVTNAKVLAHRGKFMHGMLQAIMMNDNELKIVCLKGKELSRALKHCQGNQLIKNLEFCFCTFNEKVVEVFKEITPTLKNLNSLTLNIVVFELDFQLNRLLQCIGNTGIKKIHIFGTLGEKRDIEAMIESMKSLSSLEFLKVRLEEECQMDANLLQNFIKAGSQFLNSNCVFDVDIGTRYNLVTKESNLNDFEKFEIVKALDQNWPPSWGPPPKSTDETKFLSSNFRVKQHLEITQRIEEKSLNEHEIQTTEILDREGLNDERNENIEIIESSKGVRKYCLDGGIQQLESLRSLHLRFKGNQMSDKEMIFFCSGIRYLQSLKTLYLIFNKCKDFSDKGLVLLSCNGKQKLSSLTSLSLTFKNCEKITDEGLMSLSSEWIQNLQSLTSLDLSFKSCQKITDEGLKTLGSEGIQKLPSLTSLSLRFKNSEEITDEGLMRLSSEGIRNLLLLTSLGLSFESCKEITDEGLMRLSSEGIRHLLLLTSLELNFGNCLKITGKGLMVLSSEGIQHLPLLTSLHLNFNDCSILSSEGILHRPLLTSLHPDFDDCSLIRDQISTLKILGAQKRYYLSLFVSSLHLQSLTFLSLNFGGWLVLDQFADEVLMILNFEGMPFCTSSHLNLRSSLGIIAENLNFAGIRNLPLLTSLHLNFESCRSIGDEALEILGSEAIKYLPLLTSLSLNFKHCKGITDEGLMSLRSEGIQNLQWLTSLRLNFEGCNKITDEGFKTLVFESIKHLPLLTSLQLELKDCDINEETIENILSTIQSRSKSLPIHRLQGFSISNHSINFSKSSFQNVSNSNQKNAFRDYHVKPGFYFKDCPFGCEENIPKLLKNYSFHDKIFDDNCEPKETQQNYQVTFHLNFKSESIDDDISNLADAAPSWQNVKVLNLMFNDCSLFTPQRLQSYWDMIQYFKSIIKLHLNSNQANFPLEEAFSSLFNDERLENLKLLKMIDLIFPNVTLNPKVRKNIIEASSSSFALNLLTKREFEMEKADFQMNKQSVQSILKKSQVFEIKSQEIQTALQSHLILFENFDETDLNQIPIQNIQSITRRQRDGESEFQSASNENTNKIHFEYQREIANSKDKFEPFHSREITFSMDQNISIQKLNFQELLNYKSLLELNINLSRRNNITNERLQTLSVRMGYLELLRVLRISFYGCRNITDKGISSLSSQGLKQLRKLTELSLDFGLCNGITDKGLYCLGSEGIQHLEFLTKLNLSFEGCDKLENLNWKGIGSLNRLTELHQNFNNCTGITYIGSELISCDLKNLQSLTSLSIDFGHNKVYNLDLRNLSQGIKHLESLIHLHLNFSHGTRITDFGLERLSDGIQHLKSLTTLYLNFKKCHQISHKGIKNLICERIRYLKELHSLHLSFDGPLKNKEFESLCHEGIRHLNSLVSLYLDICIDGGISDEGLESLCCEGIQHLDKLKSLEFISPASNYNKITDRGIKNIAFKAIPKLISLENLKLPLMRTATSSSSIFEAFRNILIYFGLQQDSN